VQPLEPTLEKAPSPSNTQLIHTRLREYNLYPQFDKSFPFAVISTQRQRDYPIVTLYSTIKLLVL
jgi:hypothetical protein